MQVESAEFPRGPAEKAHVVAEIVDARDPDGAQLGDPPGKHLAGIKVREKQVDRALGVLAPYPADSALPGGLAPRGVGFGRLGRQALRPVAPGGLEAGVPLLREGGAERRGPETVRGNGMRPKVLLAAEKYPEGLAHGLAGAPERAARAVGPGWDSIRA